MLPRSCRWTVFCLCDKTSQACGAWALVWERCEYVSLRARSCMRLVFVHRVVVGVYVYCFFFLQHWLLFLPHCFSGRYVTAYVPCVGHGQVSSDKAKDKDKQLCQCARALGEGSAAGACVQ